MVRRSVRTNERGGRTARKHDFFAAAVGWRRHNDGISIIPTSTAHSRPSSLHRVYISCQPESSWLTKRQAPPTCVAAWRSGNSVGRINEVTLRQVRLVLGWVTCTGSTPGGGTLFRYVTSHAGRLSLSSFQGR